MDVSVIIMLLCGGLFAGGTVAIVWNRLPAWKDVAPQAFKADFGQTIRIADTIQPVLLVGAIIPTAIFGANAKGLAAGLAFTATASYVAVLVASLMILIPLQRRILSSSGKLEGVETMRRKWQAGHIGRTVLSVIAFSLAVSAVAI